MKTALIIVGLLMLAGCSSAPYIDQEYGQGYQQVQDQQVAYPDAPFAKPTAEGMEGITAEGVMKSLNETYVEKPTEPETFVIIDSSGSGK